MKVVVAMGDYGEASGINSIFTEGLSDCVALVVIVPIEGGATIRGLFHVIGANESTISPFARWQLSQLAQREGARLVIVYGSINGLETGRRIFRQQPFISSLIKSVNDNVIERSATAVEIFSNGGYELINQRLCNENNGVLIGSHREFHRTVD